MKRLLFVAVLVVLMLPTAQSSPMAGSLSPSSYIVLADANTDPTGGHTTGGNMKVSPPRGLGRHFANDGGGVASPEAGALLRTIVALLLSSIGGL